MHHPIQNGVSEGVLMLTTGFRQSNMIRKDLKNVERNQPQRTTDTVLREFFEVRKGIYVVITPERFWPSARGKLEPFRNEISRE